MALPIWQIGVDEDDLSIAFQCPTHGLDQRITRHDDPDESALAGFLRNQKRDLGQPSNRPDRCVLQGGGQLHRDSDWIDPIQHRSCQRRNLETLMDDWQNPDSRTRHRCEQLRIVQLS